jgi:hypothetical protein
VALLAISAALPRCLDMMISSNRLAVFDSIYDDPLTNGFKAVKGFSDFFGDIANGSPLAHFDQRP